jgi:hypothetical protein
MKKVSRKRKSKQKSESDNRTPLTGLGTVPVKRRTVKKLTKKAAKKAAKK